MRVSVGRLEASLWSDWTDVFEGVGWYNLHWFYLVTERSPYKGSFKVSVGLLGLCSAWEWVDKRKERENFRLLVPQVLEEKK